MRVALMSLLMIPLAVGCGDDSRDSGPENTGICGEWVAVTVEFEAVVWDVQNDIPIEGAEITCQTEDTSRSSSDADGVLAFSLETTMSPGGCGYGDCNTVTIQAPSDSMQPVTMGFDEANGSTIELMYGED